MSVDIKISNCNNIEEGVVSIETNKLNLKYAFNGTGKSTVSNAIIAKIKNDKSMLESLKPFKYRDQELGEPSIEGLDSFKSVEVFNDDYVKQYVFQSDELLKGSFEVFVKTPDYDNHMRNIEGLIKNIHNTFKEDEGLNGLVADLDELIKSFGNAKGGYSKSSVLGKGLGEGNKLSNIPDEISQYSPFLKRNDINVKWLKWQKEGNDYQVEDDICPYCAAGISNEKERINKVSENFDSNIIKNLNNILNVFENFKDYFSEGANLKIGEIAKNITGISPEQKTFLKEIKDQATTLRQKLVDLRGLGFVSLENADKVSDIIEKNRINISYLSHFNSKVIIEKTNEINQSINAVLENVGLLQGEVAQQKRHIKNTIEKHNTDINNFLLSAGYKYHVAIESAENEQYKLKLYHNDYIDSIPGDETHLSYGERNAFALALFMYGALNNNPDLVILDDPISSFDGNKKFAIINMLFMGANSFKDKTVLLLTHEFSLVIDLIYNFKQKILPTPVAHFLSANSGVLSEKEIVKDDIKSFVKIANEKFESSIDIINKLIYLRRLIELSGNKGVEWDLLSSLFHKRYPPAKLTESGIEELSDEEINSAEKTIRTHIPDFVYEEQVERIKDSFLLKDLYYKCTSNYEKLQIFRLIFEELEFNKNDDNVFKHYINKTFHIENDYLFQLDPSKYDTVPSYIIEICDKAVSDYKPRQGIIEP